MQSELQRNESGFIDEDGVVRDSVKCSAYFANILGIVGLPLLIAGIILISEGLVGYGLIAAGAIFILFYWVEVFCWSKAFGYLSNVMSEEEFVEYVKSVQGGAPCKTWDIQNYHYETRTYTTTDADGNTQTRTEQVRVNTHYARMDYPIRGHTDETLSPEQMLAMFHLLFNQVEDFDALEKGQKKRTHEALLMLCKFPLDYHARDSETDLDYPRAREEFYLTNTMDTHQTKGEWQSLVGCHHKERIMVVLHPEGVDRTTTPWWMRRLYYTLTSCCFCTVPFRQLMYKGCQKTTWNITKHFSMMDPDTWTADPIYSVKNSKDKRLKAVMKLSQAPQDKREGPQIVGKPEWRFTSPEYPDVSADTTLPYYWKNKDPTQNFDTKEKVPQIFADQVQKLLSQTFKAKETRDRQDPLPKRLTLVSAHRIEDQQMWARYALQKAKIASKRSACTPVRDMEGSGEVKTMSIMDKRFKNGLDVGVNELYLWHGTSPTGAFGIREEGFRLDLAGSAVGTMFGPGAYFAENCSKSDEYAKSDTSGVFSGIYALLLCRVCCGELFRVTKSDIPAITEALDSGKYDAVLGDREAVVDTYREFVVFSEGQIYPEYVVLYKRDYDDLVDF